MNVVGPFRQQFLFERTRLDSLSRARFGCWMLPWARFSSSFFLEGPILTVSVVARSGSWMLFTRFGSNFFFEGALLIMSLSGARYGC